jgi:hypothetical protein
MSYQSDSSHGSASRDSAHGPSHDPRLDSAHAHDHAFLVKILGWLVLALVLAGLAVVLE